MTSFLYNNKNLLTNVLIIIILCIIIYFIYNIVNACYYYNYNNTDIKEGFVEQQKLTDLLSKLRVKAYDKDSIWSNELFNMQPDRKERSISFWEAKNETGDPFKKIGQCISTDDQYDMPNKNTMLIDGDTKAPVDAKMLFQFPDNIISKNEKSESEYNIYTGIRSLKDIDERLQILNDLYQTLTTAKETQISEINNKIGEQKDNLSIKIYGKESYFNNPLYTIKNGTTNFLIPEGKYSSISFPFGSELKLNSEHSDVTKELILPIDLLYKSDGTEYSIDELFNSIKSTLKLNGDDFNVLGRYGLGATTVLDPDIINDKSNSSIEMDFKQGNDNVYSPHRNWARWSTLVKFSTNYAVSDNATIEHSKHGRADIYNFIKKLKDLKHKAKYKDIYPINATDATTTNADYYNLTPENELYDFRWKVTEMPEIKQSEPKSAKISHPYILNTNSNNPPIDIDVDDGIKKFKEEITKNNGKYYWFNMQVPSFTDIDDIDNIKIDANMYEVNLAFMLTVIEKKLRLGFMDFPTDVEGMFSNCCEMTTTEESLSRHPDFQGYLTGGSVSLNIPESKNPYINAGNQIKSKLQAIMDKSLPELSQNIQKLDNLKRDILENKFQHFPIKIYRPIPPKNYIILGDVIYNHHHVNYNIRYPILDNIACIPYQCYKEVRDWLASDKVYEYRQGDVYLAFFKNPYLQTFSAVTVPDTFPPNRVGKVVACVENCKLLDDIIEADKCAKQFFKANKAIIEGINLDPDNIIINRESALYKNKIQDKQDRINTLKEVSRRLQIQDDKANIVNRQYNKQKLQNLVDRQRRNINTLVDELEDGKNRIDVNVKFSYEKFQGLMILLKDSLPPDVGKDIIDIVDKSARKKLDVLPDEDIKDILNKCPTPDTEGLVVKALVESGCYNCYNLQ